MKITRREREEIQKCQLKEEVIKDRNVTEYERKNGNRKDT
jgi:hypothetical protein